MLKLPSRGDATDKERAKTAGSIKDKRRNIITFLLSP